MEILAQEKTIFSWIKKATNGSSFLALEKKFFTSKIAMESWISF